MTWSTQPGKSRGFPPAQRLRILARDPICRCAGCPRCTSNGCTASSTEADSLDQTHTDQGQGMCTPCHAHRSASQGLAARGHGPTRKRPAQRHPGLR